MRVPTPIVTRDSLAAEAIAQARRRADQEEREIRVYEGLRPLGTLVRRGPWEGSYHEHVFVVRPADEPAPTREEAGSDPGDARRGPRIIHVASPTS